MNDRLNIISYSLAGICFVSGIAILFGGLAITVITLKEENEKYEQIE